MMHGQKNIKLQSKGSREMWAKNSGLSTPNDQQQLAPFTEH